MKVDVDVQAAIDYYNINRKKDEPRMTNRLLGLIILPEKTAINSENYIYRLMKGNETIRRDLPKKICKACGVDGNFILGTKPMKI